MLENLILAPRATRVQYRVPTRGVCCARAHTLAVQARIRAQRRHAMRYATTCCGIMNGAVLVCIRKCAYGQVDTDQPELQNYESKSIFIEEACNSRV